MKCDRCKSDTKRIIYVGLSQWFCDKCVDAPVHPRNRIGGTKVLVGNKFYPKMSHAMQMHLTTRKIRDDGKSHPDPRWK